MLLCWIKASDRQKDVAKISIGILNGYVIFCIADKYVPVDLYCLIVVTALNMSLGFSLYCRLLAEAVGRI